MTRQRGLKALARQAVKPLVAPPIKRLFSRRGLRDRLCWYVPADQARDRVALTFDDGPHPEYTPQVLDRLARRGVRATFFVLGAYVERHPHLFQRIVDEGHEFGIHAYEHHNRDLPAQIVHTAEILRPYAPETWLFRPPHGKLDPVTALWALRNGYTTVLWSFDCRDSLRHEGKDDSRRPLDEIGSGDIVLLHDDNPVCVADLDLILDLLPSRGLQTLRVSELLGV